MVKTPRPTRPVRSKPNPASVPASAASSDPDPNSLESTRTLILRVRKGDDAARERLFRRFMPGLRRWAQGRLPERARGLVDTDDVVQVSLLRALGRIDSFDPRGPGAFLGYLHHVLLNCVREEIRRASRRPRGTAIEDLPEDRPSLLERTIGQESIRAYESALGSLPEAQQQVVILRIEFGFTHKEIAETLGPGATADSVRMKVARAMVRLAEMMDAPA